MKRQVAITEQDPVISKQSRDEGASTITTLVCIGAALLVGAAIASQGKEDAPAGTIPTASTAPGGGGGGELPTVPGTPAPGGGGAVETTPPISPTTTVAQGGNQLPTTPIAKQYNFVSGNGDAKTMDCNGIPIVVDATFYKGGFSPFVGIDDKFPQDLTELRKWNVSLANSIVDGSGDIVQALDWDMAGVNVDNLHAYGDPNTTGRFAVVTGCTIDGVQVIPPYVAG